MVDIKELMRTYVFINDPDVKEVTTKFGALLLAVGAIAALVWVAAGLAGDPATTGAEDPAAATGAEEADGYANEECMPESELAEWKQTHADTVLSGDYEIRPVDAGIVCVYH